jgi:hypothetical protein
MIWILTRAKRRGKEKLLTNVGPLWRKDKDKPRRAETAPKKKYYK